MSAESNKEIVRRFNIEVIQNGSSDVFAALMAPDFVNRSAPSGAPNAPAGMWNTSRTFSVLPPTGRPVSIDVIDIVRVSDGQYVEHWGANNLLGVLAELRA